MNFDKWKKLGEALVAGVPKIINAVKGGKDPGDIKLSDFVSRDALDEVREANKRASNFIDGG
jgi:hypothetical protein